MTKTTVVVPSAELYKWRKNNYAKLTALGVPWDIASDDRRFWRVMDEGIDPIRGWTACWVGSEDVASLLQCLEEVEGHVCRYGLIFELRRLAKQRAERRFYTGM